MTAVLTKLTIVYGRYTAPESVAAVFRSLRCHLERNEKDAPDPFATEEGLKEAILLRDALVGRIEATRPISGPRRGRWGTGA